jgi:hypothetical protein
VVSRRTEDETVMGVFCGLIDRGAGTGLAGSSLEGSEVLVIGSVDATAVVLAGLRVPVSVRSSTVG